jgi:hypothetical protein
VTSRRNTGGPKTPFERRLKLWLYVSAILLWAIPVLVMACNLPLVFHAVIVGGWPSVFVILSIVVLFIVFSSGALLCSNDDPDPARHVAHTSPVKRGEVSIAVTTLWAFIARLSDLDGASRRHLIVEDARLALREACLNWDRSTQIVFTTAMLDAGRVAKYGLRLRADKKSFRSAVVWIGYWLGPGFGVWLLSRWLGGKLHRVQRFVVDPEVFLASRMGRD